MVKLLPERDATMEIISSDDKSLITAIKEGVKRERKEQALFLKRLAEVDRRKLWAKMAYSSLYDFCLNELGLSESSAGKRIQVCRVIQKFAFVLDLLKNNKITMTNITILAPCLTEANAKELFQEAQGLGRYRVEEIKCRFVPKSEPRDSITPIARVPIQEPSPEKATSSLLEIVAPMEKEVTRVRISYVANDSLVKQMQKVKDLLAHKYPQGRLEDIEAEVYGFYLKAQEEKIQKVIRRTKNSEIVKHTRYTPVAVKREVTQRDEARCSYESAEGKRCDSTWGLEMDHRWPFALGGRSDLISNRRLLCRAHNQLEAERNLGRNAMSRHRSSSSSPSRRLGLAD